MTNLKGGGPEKFGAIRSFFYERLAEPSLEPLHRRIASEIPIERGRLLDIGCGPGNLDRLLAAQRPGLSVVGVDESEAMIRRAARGTRLPNLEFRRGIVQGLSFRDEFDFALSVLSFHHWEEPEAGLEAVHRALKPGGRFWIYEGDPEAPWEELRRDQRPLFGWLRLPERLVRKGLRGHGFTAAEADRVVRPAVARTFFRTCEISRSGSMLRISMVRQS
ncbi:MAG TPA: class I SAM-dependent methyltransferase [Thermoanaerobaculia bacterium]|nr:class I SAM-dependent methyltransferase [Thermoanaerobaculia bacterium]